MRTERTRSANNGGHIRRNARQTRAKTVRRWFSGPGSWVLRRNARWVAEVRSTPPLYLT